MPGFGWRTCVVSDCRKLSLEDGQMLVVGDEGEESVIPIEQLRSLMIADQSASLTTALLTALAENHVRVVFCDKKQSPVCELGELSCHSESAGAVMDQARWTELDRHRVWAEIVRQKICNQRALAASVLHRPCPELDGFLRQLQPGDPDNIEGQAARVYFTMLFGASFTRWSESPATAALNYGYTILCSAFSRVISLHGYHTGLGIHHRSRANQVNLSCDLMEPFRPFIDRIVVQDPGRDLDWPYKQILIASLQGDCVYNGRHTQIATAVEQFTLEALRSVDGDAGEIGVISLE